MTELQYPIGNYIIRENASREEIKNWINDLEIFPEAIKKLTLELSLEDLQKTYRPEGWSIAQVVHHCSDSHINCLMRLKLAITEDNPTIRPYFEDLWAMQIDYTLPINVPLNIIENVHLKLVILFKNLEETDWQKKYYHPQNKQTYNLIGLLSLYAWHCKHHLAHVVLALK
jgi:hypothetical protein